MRVSRKEKIQLGYSMSPHIPSSPRRSSGIDFSDVFGGPPRRASMQEVQTRHDDDDDHTWRGDGDGDEEMVTGRSSWSVNPRENSVFGDEIVSRRRYPSQDFFNDIFRGDNPQSSSPRIGGRDPSCSSPSSRVMSPVRSLPPGAVPLGSPAPFSLSGYRRSPLSHKASADDDEELGKDIKVEGSGGGTRVPNGGGNQFHFSIHKWASKGMPLVMSLGKRNSSRSKIQLERSLSLNGSAELESDTLVGEIQPAGVNDDCLSFKVHVVSSATKESDPIADKVEESTPKEMKDVSKPDIEANKSDLKQSANKRNNISYQKNLGDDTAREKTEERVKEDTGKDKGKGKVKEFVKIFNQEPSLKPTADAAVGKTKSPSSRWRYNDESRVSSKSTLSSSKTDGKRQGFDVNFRLDSSPKVDGNHTPSSEKESEANNVQEPCQSFSIETDNFGSTMGSASDGLQASRSSIDVAFESFVIEELPEIQDKTSESREDNEDVRAYESKIQTWSKGKEGNIRALLSTLQYVLWPNSGWKPVPLVDIIEANAVKRSYQRALLYLHPDKLQQKGAASHHKFIAEKVFKILQEAWDQFNALGSL